MMDFTELHGILNRSSIRNWREILPQTIDELNHGDLDHWLKVFEMLPDRNTRHLDLTAASIKIGSAGELTIPREELTAGLKLLHPWRKGPFDFFGIHIDTEWRSDMKWDRLKNHISPLKGRKVLDVGCGNGYHCLRMAGEGAQLVIGVEPFVLFVLQFMVFKEYLRNFPVFIIPRGIEDLPKNQPFFDTVFSMGVLYHRKSPFDHLQELRSLLLEGGELVLETLVINGDENTVLVPPDRYGKMRNVWFLPSPQTMLQWLERAGFKNPQLVDVTKTTLAEQRKTEWMTFESLDDFLNPDNEALTVENLPAPRRAVFICKK
ncbi:MAG: tRNA 5-methoxyuridine(34)/uridine 5-oxyacetic acid(34) synthase CmoB [Candidatus Marinimicrobia bacterium]|nr:tRNA 5-methoxyuridine(34)/uridine 5-oxyacetic acid(34) synthase CmoB [Candidatus Neomarinimicrobiota bacterium]